MLKTGLKTLTTLTLTGCAQPASAHISRIDLCGQRNASSTNESSATRMSQLSVSCICATATEIATSSTLWYSENCYSRLRYGYEGSGHDIQPDLCTGPGCYGHSDSRCTTSQEGGGGLAGQSPVLDACIVLWMLASRARSKIKGLGRTFGDRRTWDIWWSTAPPTKNEIPRMWLGSRLVITESGQNGPY